MTNNYLISYDISNNKLRTRLAKLLMRHGCKRLQKSVFLAPNFSLEELTALKMVLRVIFQHKNNQNNDSLICFSIPITPIKDLLWHGQPDKIEDMLRKTWNLLI